MFVFLQPKNMKNLKFISPFLLFSLLIIFSCSNDDDSDNETFNPRSENIKEIGVSSRDLLSANNYKSLTIEFAYSPGFRPKQQTLDDFKTFLEERLHKPDGIIFIETLISIPFQESQTLQDIKTIEANKRTIYTEGDDISVFVYFSGSNYSSDTQTSLTLGISYYNTSLVVFEKTLRNLVASQDFDLYILEETTLQHELGHLLGLVNIQNDDIHQSHEDLAHGKHCKVEDCLMYYENNNGKTIKRRASVSLLDPLCLEDIQAKGGK